MTGNLKRLAAGCALGSVATLLGIIGVALVLRNRSALPPLTADDLAAAQRLWDEQGPSDYDLDVEIGGRQSGRFRVEVRSGKPTQVTRNDVSPQRRTWDTWTVPGMFDTLQQELDLADRPDGAFGQPGARAVMWAVFDAQLGYPRRYERFVLGTPYEVRWEVTRFEAVDR
ncbi:MAG TPA: DUF6174 domain-containing protein [Pirellulales bacterium]|nr:DUF6174 domain-containing protein [Pirellulales bacterium]